MTAVLAFIEGFLQLAPSLIALGADIAPLIANVKTAVEDLFNGGSISDDQKAALDAQVAAAETAWAAQVAKAQAEIDGAP